MSRFTEHPDEGNKGRTSNPINRIKNLTKKLNRQAALRSREMQRKAKLDEKV